MIESQNQLIQFAVFLHNRTIEKIMIETLILPERKQYFLIKLIYLRKYYI